MAINPENKNIVHEITRKLNDLIEVIAEYQNLDKDDESFGTFICSSDMGYHCDCHASA